MSGKGSISRMSDECLMKQEMVSKLSILTSRLENTLKG